MKILLEIIKMVLGKNKKKAFCIDCEHHKLVNGEHFCHHETRVVDCRDFVTGIGDIEARKCKVFNADGSCRLMEVSSEKG